MLPPYYLLFNVDIYNRELWYLTSLSTIFKLYRGGQFFFLMEETGVPGENHQPTGSHRKTLSHNVVSSTPRLSGIRTRSVSSDGQ
jgi:hypothetical protein